MGCLNVFAVRFWVAQASSAPAFPLWGGAGAELFR